MPLVLTDTLALPHPSAAPVLTLSPLCLSPRSNDRPATSTTAQHTTPHASGTKGLIAGSCMLCLLVLSHPQGCHRQMSQLSCHLRRFDARASTHCTPAHPKTAASVVLHLACVFVLAAHCQGPKDILVFQQQHVLLLPLPTCILTCSSSSANISSALASSRSSTSFFCACIKASSSPCRWKALLNLLMFCWSSQVTVGFVWGCEACSEVPCQ